MTKTTIQITGAVKEELEARKASPSESYSDVLRRVFEDSGVLWTELEIRAIARDEANGVIEEYR